jgi:hypothetical protein
MKPKKFKLKKEEIKQLLKRSLGAGMATDKIMVDGELVDYMYRDEPFNDVDSGWRFLSGTEDQDYVDDADHWAFYDLNTIANYDTAIINYLELPVGTELERIKGTDKFEEI